MPRHPVDPSGSDGYVPALPPASHRPATTRLEEFMTWQTPSFEEINMSAEIGGYQGDDGGGNVPPAPTADDSAEQG
jgi:hypothetical protein